MQEPLINASSGEFRDESAISASKPDGLKTAGFDLEYVEDAATFAKGTPEMAIESDD